VKRIAEIVESWVLEGTHFQSFIRYNPHGFTVNGVEQKVSQEKRLEKLFEILNDESHEIYNVEKPSEDHAHVLRHATKSRLSPKIMDIYVNVFLTVYTKSELPEHSSHRKYIKIKH
jgi:uncharacterized protein YjaG (DUF416 family)